jgi:spore coat polysaccharide biosynthesis protein SpsF
MSERVLIVVQARVGSTRFPGKILQDLGGRPMLLRMLQRLQAVRHAVDLVVATTTEARDEPIVRLCGSAGVPLFRGHPTDLLDRHYQVALTWRAAAVAKIPSDCPLIDPVAVDDVLTRFERGDADYASNLHPATWPDGNDVEVMRFEVLQAAWREARLPMEREHTTPFIWERPERFHLANVTWGGIAPTGSSDCSMSHRWTVDYPEDYLLIRAIFEELYPLSPLFGVGEILNLLHRKPELAALNARHRGVNWYRHHLHELKTVDARQTRVG